MTAIVSAVARPTEPLPEGTPRPPVGQPRQLSAAAARLLAADRSDEGPGFQSSI